MTDNNTVYTLFKHTANKYPKKIAIFTQKGKINYETLLTYTNKIAAYLQQHIKKGDNIGIFMENSWQYVVATYAISAVGATFVPINSTLKSKELSYILNDADIKCLFASHSLEESVFKSIAIYKCNKIVWVGNKNIKRDFAAILEKDISFSPKYTKDEDTAAIFYTSGTTGMPKGAMLSNKNILSIYKYMIYDMKLKKSDRLAIFLPMHFTFTLLPLTILPICYGASTILTRYHSAQELIKTLVLKRATILFAVPIIYTQLVKISNNWFTDTFNRIRLVISGTSPISIDLIEKVQEKFKKAIFIEGYGLTETTGVTAINPSNNIKLGSVGKAISECEIKIVDSYDIALPPRTVGEIIIKGNNIMKSYLNSNINNPCSIYNGWLFTGDLGYLDDDGYLYITGRKKDLIIYNSFHIYPQEVESIINTFEGIKESTLIGKTDDFGNEIPIAFIVQEDNYSININKLKKYIEGFLSKTKIPQEFIIIDTLPRNRSGKVLKNVLRNKLNEATALES